MSTLEISGLRLKYCLEPKREAVGSRLRPISSTDHGTRVKYLFIPFHNCRYSNSHVSPANSEIFTLDMANILAVSQTAAIFCTPLEIHYLDEHAFILVFMTEVM